MSSNSRESLVQNDPDDTDSIVDLISKDNLEWQVKYEKLFEAHRKLQKTNNSLEDKLLRIVEKFEAEKNQMRRDLASQTQRLVESKLTIQRLHDQNRHLQSDLNLSINLLRNRPNSFVSQKIESLPADVRASVRTLAAEKHRERSEGKKIRVAIPDDVSGSSFSLNGDQDELVSAAILAKVLEERDKERRRDRKFCIDVGTQTHGWQFPGKSAAASAASSSRTTTGGSLLQNQQLPSSSSTGSGASPSKSSSGASSSTSGPSSPSETNNQAAATSSLLTTDNLINHLESDLSNFDAAPIKPQRITTGRIGSSSTNNNSISSNYSHMNNNGGAILLTSVIHTGSRQVLSVDDPSASPAQFPASRLPHSFSVDHSFPRALSSPRMQIIPSSPSLVLRNLPPPNTLSLPPSSYIPRSVTCSTLQTDI